MKWNRSRQGRVPSKPRGAARGKTPPASQRPPPWPRPATARHEPRHGQEKELQK
jgi:hypothetical protein